MICLCKSRIAVSFLSALFVALCCVSGNALAQDALAVSSQEEDTQNVDFAYSPAGRRDPFAPLIQKILKTTKKPTRDLGPLEKYQLSQFRLLAMLIIDGSPRAMVKSPDGKSYTVKLGDLIGPNNGVVKRIETKTIDIDETTGQRIEKSPDRIVVEETGIENYTGKVFKEERYIEM